MALAYDGKPLPVAIDIQYLDVETMQPRAMNQQVKTDMSLSHLATANFNRLVDPSDDGDPLIGKFVPDLDYEYQDHGQTVHENFDHWMRYNLIAAPVGGVNPAYVFMFLLYKALRTHDQKLVLAVNQAAGLPIKKKPAAASSVPVTGAKAASTSDQAASAGSELTSSSSTESSVVLDPLLTSSMTSMASPAALPFGDNPVKNVFETPLAEQNLPLDNQAQSTAAKTPDQSMEAAAEKRGHATAEGLSDQTGEQRPEHHVDAVDEQQETSAASAAADEYFDDKEEYTADVPPADLTELSQVLNDKYDLATSLFEIQDTPLADGLFNVHYRIKDSATNRATVLSPLYQVMRQVLISEFHDLTVNDLIHQLAYGDVITAYFLYMAAKNEQISRRLYERYCLAYALLGIKQRFGDILQQSTSLGQIVQNDDLPVRVRWFLYMNKHAPQAKKDLINQLYQRLGAIDDKLDIHTVLLASQLASYEEADWSDALYGRETKRALHKIDDSHDDLVAPLKTMRRTRQVRRRNRRK